MKKRTYKVYQLNNGYIHNSIIVYIDGNPQSITFEHGNVDPYHGGKFGTTDPKIQEALEKRKDFGTKLIVIYQETTGDAKEDKEIIINRELATPNEGNHLTKEESANIQVVTDVTGFQQARAWLVKNTNLKHSDLPNKAAVLEAMQTHEVQFPEWITE